jgi:hypothetical protein
MAKGMKRLSVMLVMGLLVMALSAFTASAESEQRFDLEGGNYITVSNVVKKTTTKDVGYGDVLYVAKSPVTVTFHGDFKDAQVVEWPDDESLDYVTIKDNKATLVNPVRYGIFPYESDREKGVILLELVGENTETAAPEQPAPAAEPASTPLSAAPTASKVLVDSKAVAFEAYNIDGNNFFKLRDLAKAVSSSKKSFEIEWDSSKNAISLTTGKPYTPDGSELAVSGSNTSKPVTETTAQVYVNEKQVKFTAYNIDGNNYVKLRDVAKVIDFGVTWNENASSIGIDTAASYTE